MSVASAGAALETSGLCKSFGALAVAQDIDFRLERGVRHALIGPNGAGKTSFVNLVTGVLEPTAGMIRIDDVDVTRLPQAARVKRGLVRTFQISALFRRLCALENVALAVAERDGIGGQLWRPAGGGRPLIGGAPRFLRWARLCRNPVRPARDIGFRPPTP